MIAKKTLGISFILLVLVVATTVAQSQISPATQYFKDDYGTLLTLGANGQYRLTLNGEHMSGRWEISGLTIRLYNSEGRLFANCSFQWGQGRTISWVELLDGIRLNRITN